jgi:hypothetical protein
MSVHEKKAKGKKKGRNSDQDSTPFNTPVAHASSLQTPLPLNLLLLPTNLRSLTLTVEGVSVLSIFRVEFNHE